MAGWSKNRRDRRSLGGAVALLATLAMMLVGLVAPFTAQAAEVTGDGSITFTYKHHGDSVPGVNMELHRVATWSKNWQAEPVDAFKDFKVDWPSLNDMSQDELRNLANTLAGYVQRDDIEPLQKGETDANGIHTFENLPDGLYLITYGRYADDDMTCESGALLVSLPTSTDKDGTPEGVKVEVEPKTSCTPNPPTPPDDDEHIKVVKVWKDSDDEEHKRPAKVVIQLLKDGVVVEEVELNESNNWTHEWTDLDKDHEWTVVEKVVADGYTTSTDREGTTITIVNTYDEEEPPTPEEPEEPGEPNEPGNPETPTTPDTPGKEIGKTGSTIVGAVVLAVALVGIGVVMLKVARGRGQTRV